MIIVVVYLQKKSTNSVQMHVLLLVNKFCTKIITSKHHIMKYLNKTIKE